MPRARSRRAGTRFGIQLAHAGRKASCHTPWDGGRPLASAEGAWQTVAPSPVPFADGGPPPVALDEQGLARVKAAFVQAAERAVRLGFDAIELHLAHGYLLHAFVSPLSNRRTDRYGGSLENRMRFPLEVAQAVRAVVPPASGAWCPHHGHRLGRRRPQRGRRCCALRLGSRLPDTTTHAFLAAARSRR